MVYSYKNFEQFQEPSFANQWLFPLKQNSALVSNSFSSFIPQSQKVANRVSDSSYAQYVRQQNMRLPSYYGQFQAFPRVAGAIPSRTAQTKVTLWDEFKRIYITEVIAFTMSKSTLFTLIFSFMFLGCIFFLSGFFTATNIYREQQVIREISRQHVPTETAALQGRPEKIVNMGTDITYATPQAYQYQGGVKVDQNRRRPSAYAEQQINSSQPNYR